MHSRTLPAALIAASILAAVAPAAVSAQPAPASYADVVEKVSPSVATIFSSKTVRRRAPANPMFDDPRLRRFFGLPDQGGRGGVEKMEGLGSGVVVSADGYIVTNNHVIDGADEILVQVGADEKKEYKAKLVGTDPRTDLAVLKIEGGIFSPLAFGDAAQLRVGDVVLALGSPFGLRQSVSMGIVSAIGRGSLGLTSYGNFIQTDAAINMGNSGGPLVNTRGELVGINTAIHTRSGGYDGIGFCVPANLVADVYGKLRKDGKVTRGYLGINLQELTEELAGRFGIGSGGGVLVADVMPGEPAAKAGVKNGDVILSINGQAFSGPEELRNFVAALSPGSDAELKLLRAGKEQSVTVKLGELPGEDRLAGAPGRTQDVSNALDGITVGDITAEIRQRLDLPENLSGAVITAIEPECAGYEAGLREGDVVLEVNQQAVRSADEAVEASRKVSEEEDALLRVANSRGVRYVIIKAKDR